MKVGLRFHFHFRIQGIHNNFDVSCCFDLGTWILGWEVIMTFQNYCTYAIGVLVKLLVQGLGIA